MVLDHVAQLAGLVEVAPAALDAHLLGHGDFHVGNVVLVPLGLEQAVGEAQGDQVLHRLLAQVVVDPVGAVLRKMRRYRVVHHTRRFQVMADGLLKHHAGALGQPGGGQAGADGAIDRGGRGEVGDQLGNRTDAVGQGRVGLGVEEVHGQVIEARHEALQGALLHILGRHMAAQVLANGRQVDSGIAAIASQGEDSRLGRQQAGAVQLIERREQLAQRQVAKGPEQGQGTGFDEL
ncbi:hypothetical protein D9M68_459760 [compost metagenome]